VDTDIAIIGAGVVGLAIAQRLAPRRQVAVIDRHGGYGYETSSHNSGVIHAGIYYPTGSLKHTLCLEGNRLLYDWCAAHGVRVNRLGKLIVAVDESELDALAGVEAQAAANGVPGIQRIDDRARLRELEPAVTCVAALWSETSGVVDQSGLMASFAAAATASGAWIALKHEITSIARVQGGFELTMLGPDDIETTISAEMLINSAGLSAPAIATMLGYPIDGDERTPILRQRANKGRYYDIVAPEKARAINHLVYPVPEHAKGGLGVHVTLDVDGGVHLGPDTEWLDDDHSLDYRADDLRRADFHAAASRYLSFLQPEDLAPGQVGYRPKLQLPGGEQADFLIWNDGPYIHLGGIESPGMTASLAIARSVAAIL
jgi:L-2-hydroxyglutarate oxidase LhgO